LTLAMMTFTEAVPTPQPALRSLLNGPLWEHASGRGWNLERRVTGVFRGWRS
jgi:hypothetical protein